MAYKGYTMKMDSYDIPLDELLLQLRLANEALQNLEDDENEVLDLLREPAAAHDDTLGH